MSGRSLGAVAAVLVVLAEVSACSSGSPGAVRTVTQTQTQTVTVTEAPSGQDDVFAPPLDTGEFVADEDAFYAKSIELDKSLLDMTRETVTGYGWNLCMIESTADLGDPMYKNLLGPAKARGTLEAAHTYLCPDNG